MATRKGTSASTVRKAATAKQPAERRDATPAATVSSNNPNRLLREAAWSAMFGRIESKNPFTR
jgi:hypothetical protein